MHKRRRFLFGEFIPDAPEVGFQGEVIGMDSCANVVPVVGGYRTIQEWETFSGGNTVSTPTGIIGGFSAKDGADTVDFVADDTNVYMINNALSLSTVTGAAGTAETNGDVAFRDFTQYGSRVIVCSGDKDLATTVGEPAYFDLGVSASFTQLTSVFSARTVAALRDFVVFGNTHDNTDGHSPTRVRWSAFGDSTDYTPSAQTQSDWRDLKTDIGEVQNIVGGDDAFIVGTRGTVLMTYVGPPTLFRFDYIHPGIGTDHPQSVVRIGSHVYFRSDLGFVRAGPAKGDLEWIGAGKVDEAALIDMRAGVNTGTRMRAYHDPQNNMVGCIVDDNVAKAYVYHYPTGRWAVHGNLGSERANCSFLYTSDIESDTSGAGARQATCYGIGTNGTLYCHNDESASSQCLLGTGLFQLEPGYFTSIERVYPLAEAQSGPGLKNPRCKVESFQTLNEYTSDAVPDYSNQMTWNTEGFWEPTSGYTESALYQRFEIGSSTTLADRAPYIEWRGFDVVYSVQGKF